MRTYLITAVTALSFIVTTPLAAAGEPEIVYRATSVTLAQMQPSWIATDSNDEFLRDPFDRWQRVESCEAGLNGDAVKALLVAYEEFRKDENHRKSPDIRNFHVGIYETSASVYIGFCPKRMPSDPEWMFGGSTGAGAYIYYDIQKPEFTIRRLNYAE